MNASSESDRLTRMEGSIAHLERLCDQLNNVVIEQDRQLTRLQKRLEKIAEDLEVAAVDRSPPSQERPPHYGR